VHTHEREQFGEDNEDDEDGGWVQEAEVGLRPRLLAVYPKEHYHEKEKDDNGPAIDDDLDRGEEVGALVNEHEHDAEDHPDKGEGAMDRVALEDDACCAGEDEERPYRVNSPGRADREPSRGKGGYEQVAHRCCPRASGLTTVRVPVRCPGRAVLTPTPRSSPASTSRMDTSKSAGTSAASGSDWPAWGGRTP
jgi:hypothetical protein